MQGSTLSDALNVAVTQVKDLSPLFNWVGNYLACSIETASELVVLIRDREGRIVGQIDIDSHTRNAFGPSEEAAVRAVADDLGRRWPTESGQMSGAPPGSNQ